MPWDYWVYLQVSLCLQCGWRQPPWDIKTIMILLHYHPSSSLDTWRMGAGEEGGLWQKIHTIIRRCQMMTWWLTCEYSWHLVSSVEHSSIVRQALESIYQDINEENNTHTHYYLVVKCWQEVFLFHLMWHIKDKDPLQVGLIHLYMCIYRHIYILYYTNIE